MYVLNLGIGGSRYRFSDVPTISEYDLGPHPRPFQQSLDRLAGKRVCILVPGYNVDRAVDSCAAMVVSLDGLYDEYIVVDWPGSNALGFWWAYHRAEEAGRRVADVFRGLRSKGVTFGVQTHSTGARIALEAARQGMWFDHSILSAAAVPADALAGEYADAVPNLGRIGIFYSWRDKILKYAYGVSMLKRALGSIGPRGRVPSESCTSYDMTQVVAKHGDYKDVPFYYEEWARIAMGGAR